MLARKLLLGVLACGVGMALALGCVIEEREYNPLASVGLGLASVAECKTYCQTVQATCTGPYALYLTDDTDGDGIADDCMGICQRLPAHGDSLTPGPDKSNSIACRQSQAEAAVSEPSETTCDGAGPAGSGRCGDTCETYCSLRASVCGDQPDVDVDRCLRGCPALEPGNIYDSDPMSRQDTLQCRLNHLVFASRGADMAKVHCPHTSLVPQRSEGQPDPPCADASGTPGDCQTYCKLVTFACQGADRVYESAEQCLAVCKAFPLGTAEQTGSHAGENTVACRRYHAYAALGPEGPATHCPHAGPTGDGHCDVPEREQSNCFSYCRVLERACPQQFAQSFFAGTAPRPSSVVVDNAATDAEDLGTCMESCMTVPGHDPDSRYSVERAAKVDMTDDQGDPQGDRGDVLQCRMLHAIRALGGSSGSLPTPSECAAAMGVGDCQQ